MTYQSEKEALDLAAIQGLKDAALMWEREYRTEHARYERTVGDWLAVKAERDAALKRCSMLEAALRDVLQQTDDDIEYAAMRSDIRQLVAGHRVGRWRELRELLGYVQDGSHTTVSIGQDDATYDWCVTVGKKTYYERSLEGAIDAALLPSPASASVREAL